jgi:hypothetical protein
MKRVSALVRLVLCLAVATCLLAPTPVSGITYSGYGCSNCPWGYFEYDPHNNIPYYYCVINSGYWSPSTGFCRLGNGPGRGNRNPTHHQSWTIIESCADACTPGAKRCTSSTVRETCNNGCPGTYIYLQHSHSIVILFSSFLHPHLCHFPPISFSVYLIYQAPRLLGEALTTALRAHQCAKLAHAPPMIVPTRGILTLVARTRLAEVTAVKQVSR